MKSIFKPLLILLSLGLVCQNFGPVSDGLGRLLVFCLLTVYFFAAVPRQKGRAIAMCLFIAGALFTVRLNDPLLQLTGISLLLFALALYARWRGLSENVHALALLSAVVFAVIFYLYKYFPEGWYAAEACARFFSYICSKIYFRRLSLGTTAFGFFIFISFVIYHAVLFGLERKRSITRFVLIQGYLICSCIIFVGLNLFVDSIVRKYTYAVSRTDLHTQALLFLMLCLSLFFRKKGELNAISILPAKRVYKYALVCLAAFAVSLILYSRPFVVKNPAELKTIVFYKQGSLDWKTAKFGSYGKRSGGMFGIMPKYLKAVGFKSRMIDSISPSSLAEADVLVMINLNKGLQRKELFTVWNFVKHGGGLLLLGDHTNLGGLMQNFNQILRVVPLRFKFDSAMPSRYTWDYLMDIRPDPITNGFKSEITRSWWVGASLSCSLPTEPLVIGRYCYSDRGYKKNVKKAYLGNRRFDSYELQNDVVLAAWAPYGKGKIMACGDTSAFHNTTFMTTYPFVVNVFNVLADRPEGPGRTYENALKIALVLSFAGCMLLFFIGRPNIIMPALLIITLCSVTALSDCFERRQQIREIPYDKIKVAYIDYSHNERFDLMSWEDDSIGGLKNNLMRNGLYPFLLSEFDKDKLQEARVLIIIAPTKPFAEHEVEVLKDFIKRGGNVILSVGWEEKEASMPILASFSLDVDNVPLAWCEYEYKKYFKSKKYKTRKIQFREAWPLIFDSSRDVKVICKPMGYPVMVTKSYGAGRITVIGDSKFLLNENLEGDEKYYVPNMFLLRDLLLE